MKNYQKSDPKTICEMFNSIAKTYDRNNSILSFRLHYSWNKKLVKGISRGSVESLLDLCCGTGEIALEFLKQNGMGKKIYLLDFSEEMLNCAKTKIAPSEGLNKVSYLQADAQEIPLPNKSVESVTLAYGIRNIKDPARCIQEIFRVLQPGGTVGILELTRPSNPVLRLGHHLYLRVLPALGWLFSSNQKAYQYLCESIHSFIDPKELEKMLAHSGFVETRRIPLSGGIATILFAKKSF